MFDRELLRQNHHFRNLFYGQAISQFGDALYYVSFMFMVEKITGSIAMVGVVGAAETLPMFLLSPYAGVLADRIDRKLILLWSDILSAAVLVALAVVAISPYPISGWALVITAFLLASVRTFFMPAKNSAIPRLVPGNRLMGAFATSLGTQNIMFMAGTAFSGTVMATIWDQMAKNDGSVDRAGQSGFLLWIVLLNAASFAWSAWYIAKLPSIIPEKQGEQHHAFIEFKQGLGYIWTRADLKTQLGVLFLFGLCIAPFFVTYVAVNKEWFGGKPGTLAWFEFAFFLGMVGGSAAVAKWPPKRIGLAFVWGCMVVGVCVGLMAFSRNFTLFAFWNLVCGLVVPFVDIPNRTYMQATVPDAFRGRVNSVQSMTTMAAMPMAMGSAGSLVQRFGVTVVLLAMGIGTSVASLLGLMGKEFREAQMPESDEPIMPEPGAHEIDPMRA